MSVIQDTRDFLSSGPWCRSECVKSSLTTQNQNVDLQKQLYLYL